MKIQLTRKHIVSLINTQMRLLVKRDNQAKWCALIDSVMQYFARVFSLFNTVNKQPSKQKKKKQAKNVIEV